MAEIVTVASLVNEAGSLRLQSWVVHKPMFLKSERRTGILKRAGRSM